MRLVQFQRYRRKALGVLVGDGRIIDVEAAAAAWLAHERSDPLWEDEVALRLPSDVGRFIAGGKPSLTLAQAAIDYAAQRPPLAGGIGGEPLFVNPDDVTLLPPLVAPLILSSGAVIEGLADHGGRDKNRHREFFMRDPFNVLGPGDDIHLPTWLSQDFEISARLAAVIGQPLRSASSAQAYEAIFGFCPAIEVCASEQQTISWAGALFHVQYPHARAFDGSLLLGPAVIGKDEIGEPGKLKARLTIEGTVLSNAPCAWSFDRLVEWVCYLSESVTLRPGTLLVSGSADDIVLQPAVAGKSPVELINHAASQSDLLLPNAEIELFIEGIGSVVHTRIQHLRQADIVSKTKVAG